VSSLWADCLNHLQSKVSSTDYSTWLRPLQASFSDGELTLYAQNQFVEKWVKDNFLSEIIDLARFLSKNETLIVTTRVGIRPNEKRAPLKRELTLVSTLITLCKVVQTSSLKR